MKALSKDQIHLNFKHKLHETIFQVFKDRNQSIGLLDCLIDTPSKHKRF